MRARSVYESLEFERGQDPKTAMGIGIEARVNDPDEVDDLIDEIDQEIGSAMEMYLPEDKRKEIARMWLYNRHEFKVLTQSADDEEEIYDEYDKIIEPKINYEVADLEAEGWEVFHEENNFGQVEVILYREK